MRYIFTSLTLALTLVACVPGNRRLANTNPSDTTSSGINQPAPALLSALFGLDNALPQQASLGLCPGAGNQDGMPVVFPLELDLNTLQAGDFQVITQGGAQHGVACVTPAPATDPGELRTILMIGEYGSKTDQPIRVEIVGNLHDKAGQKNFRGQSVRVIPFEEGPILVLAQVARQTEWSQKTSKATTCPSTTVQVVRVTWAGGITRPDGKPVGDEERKAYQVTIEETGGSQREVVPFDLADLDDNDNNHDLCLDVREPPKQITFKAGLLVDPAGDLNPQTRIQVTPTH